ncbi:MAG TPA: hypothetical protein VFC85_05845, partial [Verrucomicrobiae bacterium]|nr:hypothetical protein [Verrucomicrobiae bacterium]
MNCPVSFEIDIRAKKAKSFFSFQPPRPHFSQWLSKISQERRKAFNCSNARSRAVASATLI